MTYEQLTKKFPQVLVSIFILKTNKGEFRFAHKRASIASNALEKFKASFDGIIFDEDVRSLTVYDTFHTDEDQEAPTLAGLKGYVCTMREKNLPKYYQCSSWAEFFREMENCLQDGIEINYDNYLDHLERFENQHESWCNSYREA